MKEESKKKLILSLQKIVLATLVTLVAVVCTFTVVYSTFKYQNTRSQRITTENGIQEELFVTIGGIAQYLNIRGENSDNPVILFLHGGPGSPMTPCMYIYQRSLEKQYTIVNWDQRGSGKTYFENPDFNVDKELSFELLMSDLLEIVEYLSQRFGQEKVILIGHSWGSALGITFVKEHPELVSIYIGVGQTVNVDEGEEMAVARAIELATQGNNLKDAEELRTMTGYTWGSADFSMDLFMKERKITSKYLKNPNEMSLIKQIFTILFSPDYSLKDDLFFLKNASQLQKPLMDYLGKDFDLRTLGLEYEVPIYFVYGESDWITPYRLGERTIQEMSAPVKELVFIPDAGHSPMLDNPAGYAEVILEILNQVR